MTTDMAGNGTLDNAMDMAGDGILKAAADIAGAHMSLYIPCYT
jgi:hypothetical protein